MIPETAMGVTCSKYALSPGVAHTPTIDKELLLISNADYMVAPIFKHNPLLNNIYLGTTTGIFYFYSNYNSYDPNFDPRKRDWYKEAMENPGKSTWQDTYVDIYGTICVTNSRTFYDETGKPRGVVGADITLKSIQEDIIAMKIGETGYAFLLDNKGTIIAHPRYDEIDKEPLRSAKEDYRQAIVAITSHDEGLATAKIDGRQRYLAYYRLPTTKWSLVITVDVDEIIQPTVATQNKIDAYTRKTQAYINETLKDVLVQFIIILAIAALVILALSYLLAKTITNPIKLLLAKVAKIGEGDLETKIDDRGKDEIAELAAAFNKMTIDLKTYIANLSEITAEKERIGAEEDIIKIHPFGNMLCVCEATGQEILDALEFSVHAWPAEFGGWLCPSGLRFEVHTYIDSSVVMDENGMFVGVSGEYRVKNVYVGDESLDLGKTYTVACHNYMLQNMGDGYTMFADNVFTQDCVMLDNQVLITYITEGLGGVIGQEYAEPQGRIIFVEEEKSL